MPSCLVEPYLPNLSPITIAQMRPMLARCDNVSVVPDLCHRDYVFLSFCEGVVVCFFAFDRFVSLLAPSHAVPDSHFNIYASFNGSPSSSLGTSTSLRYACVDAQMFQIGLFISRVFLPQVVPRSWSEL